MRCLGLKPSATDLLVAKRLADIALREHKQALKPRVDNTRSPKHGYQWLQKGINAVQKSWKIYYVWKYFVFVWTLQTFILVVL